MSENWKNLKDTTAFSSFLVYRIEICACDIVNFTTDRQTVIYYSTIHTLELIYFFNKKQKISTEIHLTDRLLHQMLKMKQSDDRILKSTLYAQINFEPSISHLDRICLSQNNYIVPKWNHFSYSQERVHGNEKAFYINWSGTERSAWARASQNQQNDMCAQQRFRSAVWSESSHCAQWEAKDPRFLPVGSEHSDQTGQMPRLIWVLAGRTGHFDDFVMLRLSLMFKALADLWLLIPFI